MTSCGRFGWFSAEAAKKYGYAIYETPEGKTVCVTEVTRSEDREEVRSLWGDMVYVGPVTEYQRSLYGSCNIGFVWQRNPIFGVFRGHG